MNEKLQFTTDVTDFERAKDRVNAGFQQIDGAADRAAKSATNSMNKVTEALNQTASASERVRLIGMSGPKSPLPTGGAGLIIPATGGGGGGAAGVSAGETVGSVVGATAGAGRVSGAATRAGMGTASRVGLAIAGRSSGATVGRALGGIGGPVGMVAGALIGGALGRTVFGGGPSASERREEESINRINQMIVRGIEQPMAKSIDRLSRDIEAKFQISADSVSDAIMKAQRGDTAGLDRIMQDAGMDLTDSVNEAVRKLDESARGAAEARDTAERGAFGGAVDRFLSTPTGVGVGSFVEGVKNVPRDLMRNVSQFAAGGLDALTNWLGGPNEEEAPGAPVSARDRAIDREEKKPERRARGDLTVTVAAPKSIMTTTQNTGGR